MGWSVMCPLHREQCIGFHLLSIGDRFSAFGADGFVPSHAVAGYERLLLAIGELNPFPLLSYLFAGNAAYEDYVLRHV